MKKFGIFYGSTTGTTEELAGRVAGALGVSAADVHNVANTSAAGAKEYDVLVLGSSTWGSGELQDDWYDFLKALGAEDLSGKAVALFGCGDSESYPDTFCDALALIRDGLSSTGCRFVGAYEPQDYVETGSAVCRDGKFVGLAVDEMNEPDKTEARLARWAGLVKEQVA